MGKKERTLEQYTVGYSLSTKMAPDECRIVGSSNAFGIFLAVMLVAAIILKLSRPYT